ncbi:MAG: C25 family cysteine peptidase, partial [candidate division WOR-3 bacterium]
MPGARYLIITADALASTVQPLAAWKTTKGMAARVVPLSQAGTTPAAIKAYILNAYQNWTIRPEFVLLVGSPALLPSYQDWDDGYYGNVVGNRLVELPVGRLPATTARECSTMVAKILAYENPAPGGDSTWYLKGTTVVREDVPPDAYYVADARMVHNLWLAAGYTLVESLSNLYGDSSADVNAAGSAGRAFMLYRGQATASWYTPFHQVTFGSWTNSTKLPVIVSGTCYTVTLAPGESFYGDQALRAGTPALPAGAVAFFGPTRGASSVSRYRSAATRGFFRALFEENRFRLGHACLRGKFAVDSLYGDSVRYIEWNLLGDPELNVWTGAPRRPTVIHDTIVPRDTSLLQVVVRVMGAPVANALVCVAMDTTVYEYGETDEAGWVQLVISPRHPGNLTVTVTGRNLMPYQGTCRVTSRDIACTQVVAPVGLVDSGTVVTPECELFNAGTTIETYQVRMRLGSAYDQTVVVVGHPAGTTRRVQFANWTALRRGTFVARCSCALVGDEDSTNNLAIDSVSVRVRDVGAAVIVAPRGGVIAASLVVPACTVHNYGTHAEDYQVRMTIGTSYRESVAVVGHPAGTSRLVEFPTWLAGPPGTLPVRCSTELVSDRFTANDRVTGLVTVDFLDVMVRAVLRPFLVTHVNQPVMPRVRVGNSGSVAGICRLGLEIYDPADSLVYAAADTGLMIEPAAVLEHEFGRPWVPAATGNYRVVAFVHATGDTCQANDTLRSTCTVRTGTIGWQSGPALVSGAGPVGAGGWLAGAEGDLRIHAAKGNRTAEFYAFDPVSVTWSARQPLPVAPDGRLPGKGAAGCSD